MASEAQFRVVTSSTLFRIITSYQCGVPSGLFHLWCVRAENSTIAAEKTRQTFARQLHQLPEFVAEHGDSHQLQLLRCITASLPIRSLSRVARVAARKNDAMMLKWAIDHGFFSMEDVLMISDLVHSYECGDFRAMALMEDQRRLLQLIAPEFLTTVDVYADIKDVAVIQWLHTHVPQLEWNWGSVVNAAVLGGRLELLRHVYACNDSVKWSATVLVNQPHPTPEYLTCVRFLLQHHPQRMGRGSLAKRLTAAPLEVLEVVDGIESMEKVVYKAIRIAIERKLIDALHRFVSVRWLSSDKRVDIAQRGLTEATAFLLQRGLAVVDTGTMDRAAHRGHWDLVRYLHDHHSASCTTNTMDTAAAQGRLDYVIFLHEHRTEGCSTSALDSAVGTGDIALVRYLHEVVHAPCTTAAMDRAAASGYLEVVRYLHTHRTEGATRLGVRGALNGGHHAIVQYLFAHYRQTFHGDVLYYLLLHGEFAIWEALRDQYPEKAEASIPSAMRSAGSYVELRTIRYVVHTLGRGDLAYLAMPDAPYRKGVAWLAAVWRVAGPLSCSSATLRAFIQDTGGSEVDKKLRFVIDNCTEPNAKELAIQFATESNKLLLAERLREEWMPTAVESVDLHPWLLDPRTPAWAVKLLLAHLELPGQPLHPNYYEWHKYERLTSFTWPIQAVYRRDVTVLTMTLEAAAATDAAMDPELSFEGARAAAVRNGDLSTLEWLLEHVDMPVESILLDEALFYHRYEIALWLVVHCTKPWTIFSPRTKYRQYYGYEAGLWRWLENDGTIVRSFIDVEALPWEAGART